MNELDISEHFVMWRRYTALGLGPELKIIPNDDFDRETMGN
jgi:hypothetical protein